MSEADLSPDERIRVLDLDSQLKSTLIRLCRDLQIPHSGLKSQLVSRLLVYRASLSPPSPAPAADGSISPTVPAPTCTFTTLTTAAEQTLYHAPSSHTLGVAPPGPNAGQPQLPPLPAHLASVGTGAVVPQQPAVTSSAAVPGLASLPPTAQTLTSSTHLGNFLVSPARPSAAALGAGSHGHPGYDLQQIALQAAQQAAQHAAQYAVSQVLSLQASAHPSVSFPTASLPPGPPVSVPPAPPPAHYPPYASGTHPTWIYQPPTILPHRYATTLPAASQPPIMTAPPPPPSGYTPTFAPLSGTIPTIPSKFATAAAAGEFVDFSELLHAVEVEGGEEAPLFIQVGESHQLTLPRKPKKKMISTFSQWARCLCIYGSWLTAHQPSRGPDILEYLYLVACMEQEFALPACLAYDVAFRRKAHKLRLPSWGHIDPDLYTRAFTGPGKAKPQATCDLCLSTTHVSSQCHFYSGGPVKRPQASMAGPKHPAQATATSREICLNFNRGKCSRNDCQRRHVCLISGCGGSHQAMHCPNRRSSPRKP